jgi:predicted dehydrogenase
VITNLIQSWNIRSAPSTPFLAVYGTEGSIVEMPEKRLPGHAPFEIGGLVVYSARNEAYQARIDPRLLEGAARYMKNVLGAEVPDDALGRTLARGVALDIASEFLHYNVYEAAILDLVECVGTGKRPHVEARAARADVELVFAAYESARTGRPVGLPLP